MERLERDTRELTPRLERAALRAPEGIVDEVALEYLRLFTAHRTGEPAPVEAPLSPEPAARANELKAAAYFLDADVVGTTRTEDGLYTVALIVGHVELVDSSSRSRAATRAASIAAILAAYLRLLGRDASAHTEAASDVPLEKIAVAAGVAFEQDGALVNPFLGDAFGLAAVTTNLELAIDRPLRPTRVATKRVPRADAKGPYPMASIGRLDAPTTLVLEDEVPRVPLRAQFFHRARRGDLGPKAERESHRFSMKHPLAQAMRPLFRAMVPLQEGTPASTPAHAHTHTKSGDTKANTSFVKSLAYALGASAVGICEAKRYAWYSHDLEGEPIEPYHRHAVVILVDQGHDTMEGSSGDDWMSGVQSMRAYMRGAEIACQVAAAVRKMGVSARAQTNADSHVLHIPLILWAGLGELSRIGELVLHPYLGARFKSVVVTTDLPLELDRPIDFGLQDFCHKCFKCARECPVSAISYGEPVMFNGYEMWKPDVERCTRYRVTNPNGSACGRCMKMCPFTNEGLLMHRAALWLAIHVPATRRLLAKLDDWIGHGNRNRIKKWWSDLEWLPEGRAVRPDGVNERELHIEERRAIPPIRYHHANMMPPPNASGTVPLDRKASRDAVEAVETPGEAKRRRREGEPPPAHYTPTPPRG